MNFLVAGVSVFVQHDLACEESSREKQRPAFQDIFAGGGEATRQMRISTDGLLLAMNCCSAGSVRNLEIITRGPICPDKVRPATALADPKRFRDDTCF